jgi:hypothetical protein
LSTAPETLVLRRPELRLSKRQVVIAVLMTVAVLGVVVVLLHVLLEQRGQSWRALWEGLRDKVIERPEELLKGSGRLALEMLGAAAAGWYLVRARRHERLILDRAGIRYQSPLPAGLSRLQPSWSHAWAQIRSAEIATSRLVPTFVCVVIDAVTVKRKIIGHWVPEGAGGTLPQIEHSPLVEYLRRMGVKFELRAGATGGFALESNRTALRLLVVMAVLISYAVVDWMVNTEIYAAAPPHEIFILGGVLALLIGITLLARAGVPRAETLGVALLLGVAAGIALYPGLLRVNQITGAGGLRPYEYRMQDAGVWEPADAALPTLTFTGYPEYWAQFRRGERQEFLLRRGGLDFFQLEMAPVRARMRAFYRGK